jgi:hypothetical protein
MSALMVRNIQDLRQANTPRLLEYICSLNFNVLWVAEHLRSVSLNHSTSCSPQRVNWTPTILPPDHCRSRWSAQATMVQTSGISEDMVRLESVAWPATGNDAMLQNFFPANQVYIYLSDALPIESTPIESVTELALQCILDLGDSKSMGTATFPCKRY